MAGEIIKVFHNKAVALGIIIFFTTLAYGNTFKNEFVIDDYLFIIDWPLIQHFSNVPQFFGPESQPKGEEGVYSPLKTCFHAINYHLWGLNPFGYHLVALFIHLLGTIFVFLISLRLTVKMDIAFLSGLLFGVHPVHVEAITFLTASIDTLGVVFMFISLYFYLRYRTQEQAGCSCYICSLFFALSAIFTHELTMILPLLFLLYEICLGQSKQPWREMLWRISPYLGFAVAYIFLKHFILGTVARGGYLYDKFYLTMLVIIKAWAKYILICFFPFQLSVSSEISEGIFAVDAQDFNPQTVLSQSFFDAQVLMSLALTGAIAYCAIRLWKRQPMISFCIGWFYICLLPVSNIIPTGSYFAERYLYSGTLGFCLLSAYGLSSVYHYGFSSRKFFVWLSIGVAACAVLFYVVRTFLRNKDWKNEMAFYASEVSANPRHPGMRRSLGVMYLRSGQPLQALSQLKAAVVLMDSNEDTYFALGETYTDLGNYSAAIEGYLKAIHINPEFAEAWYNLGGVYAHLKQMDKARDSFHRSRILFEREGKHPEAQEVNRMFRHIFNGGSHR